MTGSLSNPLSRGEIAGYLVFVAGFASLVVSGAWIDPEGSMIRGMMIALGIFAGIGSALIARSLGITSTFGKAAVFTIAFVVVFGGYSLWLRKAAPTSSPS